MTRVSVISACRNEAAHIGAFLDSLLAQYTPGLNLEFLVADGRSDDGTPAILRDYAARDPRIRILDNPGRIVSTGLNAAIHAASGAILIRMDAHTEYDSGYISACVDTLRRTGADNVGGPARTRAASWLGQAIAAAYHSRFSTGGARFHDPQFEGYVDTVTYGCWRRETLLRLGGFDESLVRNQDDELNYRLTLAGGRIYQSPAIVSWYRPRASIRRLFQQYFQYGFWKVAVIRKHHLPASWRHLVPCAFVLAILLLALLAPVSGICAASLALLLGAYLMATILFSWEAAARTAFRLLPVLPLIFATYHVSYGLGFLAGLIHPRRPGTQASNLFSQISR